MGNWVMEEMTDYLMHYGKSIKDGAPGRGSGRYPLGSGENPFQRYNSPLISQYSELKSQGLSEKEIAEKMGISTEKVRIINSIARGQKREELRARALELQAEGKNPTEIARLLGFKNESSVRNLLNNEDAAARARSALATADLIRAEIERKGMIDVGPGVERELGITRTNLDQALYMLELEGYPLYNGRMPQVTNPGRWTTLQVICPQGTEYKEMYDFDEVNSITDYISHDGGSTFDPKFVYPASMDPSRLMIRYAGEQGGELRDGLIEIRRGVDDLDMGESHYSQVRILVDGTHYIKGMAVYSDDMPDGVDVIFNTNKPEGTPMLGPKNNTVLKPIHEGPNPFNSLIKEGIVDPTDPTKTEGGQSYYIDKDGNKQLSLINKRSEEGDWSDWGNKLPSQFLSKQSEALIRKQLGIAEADRIGEYNEIMSLTNPTIKKKMLNDFADGCDNDAVQLKAAALPRQQYQVILPLTSISDNEVYAPNYKNGETVALIRYPHGGTFEIPILKVNNKNAEGESMITPASKDAIGINSKVAGRLSGADFDGDTVMVIPCNSSRSTVRITSTPALKGLEGFDPKMEYGGKPEGSYKKMTDTQKEMGIVSNLITDMTLRGATDDELARAVRHSMVVIDAEKHGLDYKQSEKDNGIDELKQKYQRDVSPDGKGGASTLISKAKSPTRIDRRVGSPKVDPVTGEKSYKQVHEEYVDKSGKTQVRQDKVPLMSVTKDARTLSSGTPTEEIYASYANSMKSLANNARKEAYNTRDTQYSPKAREVYRKEADSLDAKLNVALKNAPRERQAQRMANVEVKKAKEKEPEMSKKDKKKLAQQELTSSRTKVGAARTRITFTDREWEAIQAGAVSPTKLSQIAQFADPDELKERALPRSNRQISDAKQAKIRRMKASGYTTQEIADAVNVSTSTVRNYL